MEGYPFDISKPEECEICQKKCTVVVDHDHKNNFFRGFLCRDCNIGLGNFKDEIPFLKRAIAYLEASNNFI